MKYLFLAIACAGFLLMVNPSSIAAKRNPANTRVTCPELAQLKPWMTREEVDTVFGKRVSNLDDYPSWYALQVGYGGAFDGPIARVQISTIAKYSGRVAAAIVYGCPENSGFFSTPEQLK